MAPRKEVNTDIEKAGNPSNIKLREGEVSTDHNVIETVEGTLHDKYMESIAFFEEMVTVLVAETTDKNAEKVVPVGNGGRFVFFQRGVPITCARKFVDSLIVKITNVSTPNKTLIGNEQTFGIAFQSALKYPFTIIEDKNPLGSEWLRKRICAPI